MKKFLLKIFKSPAMMFSVGIIAALALFIFLKPQRFVVGMVEANSPQVVAPQTAPIGASSQEPAFLNSTEVVSMTVFSDSTTDWSIKFLPFTMSSNPDYLGQRFMLDLMCS